MTNDRTVVKYGPNGLFLLFLVFLTLKLTNCIDWSWWWITAPLWGPVALFFAIVLVSFLLVLVDQQINKK